MPVWDGEPPKRPLQAQDTGQAGRVPSSLLPGHKSHDRPPRTHPLASRLNQLKGMRAVALPPPQAQGTARAQHNSPATGRPQACRARGGLPGSPAAPTAPGSPRKQRPTLCAGKTAAACKPAAAWGPPAGRCRPQGHFPREREGDRYNSHSPHRQQLSLSRACPSQRHSPRQRSGCNCTKP